MAAALACTLKKQKIDVGVMKPFATSNRAFSRKYRSRDTAILARASQASDPDTELNPFFYSVAASPLVASEIKNQPPVNIEIALQCLLSLARKHDFIIAEGIGGLMVPLTENESVAEFAKRAKLPIIVVATMRIGTINHTLLTVMACKAFGLKVKGIILNKVPKRPNAARRKTIEVIERLTGIPVLAVVPFLKTRNYADISKIFEKDLDIQNLLSM